VSSGSFHSSWYPCSLSLLLLYRIHHQKTSRIPFVQRWLLPFSIQRDESLPLSTFFYDLGVAMFAYGRNTGAITAPEPHSISRHRYVQGFAVVTGVGEPRSACHRFQSHEDGSRRLVNRSTRGSRTNCRVVIPIRMSKLQNRAGNFDHRWSRITLSVGRRTGRLPRPQKEYRRSCEKRREEKRRRRTAWAVTGWRALVKISGRSLAWTLFGFVELHHNGNNMLTLRLM